MHSSSCERMLFKIRTWCSVIIYHLVLPIFNFGWLRGFFCPCRITTRSCCTPSRAASAWCTTWTLSCRFRPFSTSTWRRRSAPTRSSSPSTTGFFASCLLSSSCSRSLLTAPTCGKRTALGSSHLPTIRPSSRQVWPTPKHARLAGSLKNSSALFDCQFSSNLQFFRYPTLSVLKFWVLNSSSHQFFE